jgi:23S rRNA (uracil1939-C5)-methyltransferase
LKKRSSYFETQIVDTIKKSPIEKQHPTNKYGLSGGWKWINIPYEEQLKIKEEQVKDALRNLDKLQENIKYETIEGSPTID